MNTLTTLTTKTLTAFDYDVDICFRCECGCIHWINKKCLKQGWTVECYCGISSYIKPIQLDVSVSNQNSPRLDTSLSDKVSKVLRSQGYTLKECNQMVGCIEFDTDNIGELVKQALQNS